MIISNPVMQPNISGSQLEPCANGNERDLSGVFEQKQWEVNADTIFTALKTQMITYFPRKQRPMILDACRERKSTAIVGLVRQNKKMIFRDRKNIFNPFIRPTKLLKTLEAVLTTNEKVSFPFWR